jgi:predicted protein tyrosine phosphatase
VPLAEPALLPVTADRTDLICITPLRLLSETIASTGARTLVSVVNAHLMPPTPAGIAAENHLKLPMSEADHIAAGAPSPHLALIEEFVAFTRRWDRRAPLLIHCYSGLNRSPAALFIALCALEPRLPEALHALRLRAASAGAAPHRPMVVLADHLLDRHGRMIGALETIGPGSPSAEARPYCVSVGS